MSGLEIRDKKAKVNSYHPLFLSFLDMRTEGVLRELCSLPLDPSNPRDSDTGVRLTMLHAEKEPFGKHLVLKVRSTMRFSTGYYFCGLSPSSGRPVLRVAPPSPRGRAAFNSGTGGQVPIFRRKAKWSLPPGRKRQRLQPEIGRGTPALRPRGWSRGATDPGRRRCHRRRSYNLLCNVGRRTPTEPVRTK